MEQLSIDYIRNTLARTPAIFSRGENIYLLGNYSLTAAEPEHNRYRYTFDGNYGEYQVAISPDGAGKLSTTCTCPYPHGGCKHAVAAFLDIAQRTRRARAPGSASANASVAGKSSTAETPPEEAEHKRAGELPQEHLTPEEIREIALESRRERAKKEALTLLPGEVFKGPHRVRSE
jgi:hypothetical protein